MKLSTIGRFYLVECRLKEQTYFPETDVQHGVNMTEREGLERLWQNDEPLAIFEVIPTEDYLRDVSEDMARLWLVELDSDSEDDVPLFVAEHLSHQEIEEHFEDLRHSNAPLGVFT